MNENPENQSEGMEEARAEVPSSEGMPAEGTPTVDIGGSGSVPPYPSSTPSTPSMSSAPDQAQWQPGQYSAGGSGTTDLGGNMPPASSMPPPQSYPQNPPPQQAPPQSAYTPPQGQPTQYMPPPQYNQAPNYTQAGPPANYTPGQPPTYQQGNYGGGYPQPMGTAQVKDPMVGLLLELIGYVGFLGIGHIWAGKTTRGIALLIGWWVYLALSGVLTILLIGCLMFVVGLAVPIGSGLYLKNEMEKEQAAMGIRR